MAIRIFIFCTTLIFCTSFSFSQNRQKEKEAVLLVMQTQQNDWNRGDVESFMQSYWQSDSLQFVGKDIVYGWQNTLKRYQKSYPSKAAMGHLDFSDIKIDVLSPTAAFVSGAWKITRTDKSTTGGHYTLLLKKMNGKWLIVVDHTS